MVINILFTPVIWCCNSKKQWVRSWRPTPSLTFSCLGSFPAPSNEAQKLDCLEKCNKETAFQGAQPHWSRFDVEDYLFLVFFFLHNDFNFFSIIAGLQCSVNFLLYSKVTQSHIHVYIPFSHIIMLHHKWLDIVHSAIQQDWKVILNASDVKDKVEVITSLKKERLSTHVHCSIIHNSQKL